VAQTIRSRSNMSVDDTFEAKWKIVAKRVIAEPTPRTPFQAPRFGIYDYDVVPHVAEDLLPRVPAAALDEKPLISFRKLVR
jgi:hypothetical protein